jgi:hypothetical protein
VIFTERSGAYVPAVCPIGADFARPGSFGQLAQGVRDGLLALITAVEIDHGGSGRCVPHPVHQLAQRDLGETERGAKGLASPELGQLGAHPRAGLCLDVVRRNARMAQCVIRRS